MSDEQNKAVVRRIWEELFNRGDLAVADELFTSNFINHVTRAMPPGPEPMKGLVSEIRTAFPDSHFTIEDEIIEGDKVVSRVTWRGTHRGNFFLLPGVTPTGKQFASLQIHIYRIVRGKVAEHWAVRDDLGMLRQLGAIAPPGQAV